MKTLISFADRFFVEVGDKLETIKDAIDSSLVVKQAHAGVSAAEFIKNIMNVKLVSVFETGHKYDLYVRLFPSTTYAGSKLEVAGKAITTYKTVNINNFIKMAKAAMNCQWDDYVGKTISFKYKGGSEPGATRIVKVQEFKNGLLGGIDLLSENAFKNFSIDKVVGKVTVIS